MVSSSKTEPLRVTLARLVTAGDQEFMDLVSSQPVCEEPLALAYCLEALLVAAQCIFIFSSTDGSFGPRYAIVGKTNRRFQLLCEGIEKKAQGLLASSDVERVKAALSCEDNKATWEERIRGAKILYRSELVECLLHRIQEAGSEIFRRIRNEEIRATAVPIDRGVEGPAGDMPPSAITDEMFIGDDGCIHQSPTSARKWKSVYVWADQKPINLTNCASEWKSDSAHGIACEATLNPASRRGGRKKKFTCAQLETLKSIAFQLLDNYGDPEHENAHPEFRSKAVMIKELQRIAVEKKPIDFSEEPARTTIQPLVNEWLEEWRRQHAAGN